MSITYTESLCAPLYKSLQTASVSVAIIIKPSNSTVSKAFSNQNQISGYADFLAHTQLRLIMIII